MAAAAREGDYRHFGSKAALSCPMNVSPCAYRVGVSEYTLLPDVPCPLRRYQVTVTLPRQDRDEAALPPGGQAVVEMAAVAEAQGLVTVWACTQLMVSMIVELPSTADALAAGVAVARVLKGGDGMASVTVEPIA
jgi:hypothetical protein